MDMEKQWTTIRLPQTPPIAGLSPVLTKILLARGIEPAQMHSFIEANPASLRPAALLSGVKPAVALIREAISERAQITIVGDYDVDGMTASVLLHEVLAELGVLAEIIIPDRRRDGYGINREIVETIYRQAPQARHLLITVDNGSNATEALSRARELGIEVLVTDHHSVNTVNVNNVVNTVNEGVIMVNPNLPSDPYVFGGLSGVGVIWKVARELLASCGKASMAGDYFDLVALGTIADVSPLVDENRILVKLGLQMLNNNPRPGLRELIKRQLPQREFPGLAPITANEVGMYLAPCLNAAGRIGDVQKAVNLLLCRDQAEASRLAQSLVDLNQERKRITEQGMQAAKAQLAGAADLPKIICLPLLDLDESICGLVAGRIKEVYNRPTLVITRSNEETWKGSGRSIPQFDLTRLMQTISHLAQGGGHPQACGFSLLDEQMEEFLQAVELFGEQQIENRHFIKVIRVDLALDPREITPGLYRELEKLQPFGKGWEEPIIGLRRIAVTGGPMGKNGEHLRLRCLQTSLVFKGWGLFKKYTWLSQPRFMDIIGKIKRNVWQNRESIEMEIADFRVNIDNNQ